MSRSFRPIENGAVRSSKVAALVLIVGATSSISVSLARAASDCPTSATVSDWGENSTGYFNVASGGSCLFPIRMAGAVSGSEISQKPTGFKPLGKAIGIILLTALAAKASGGVKSVPVAIGAAGDWRPQSDVGRTDLQPVDIWSSSFRLSNR